MLHWNMLTCACVPWRHGMTQHPLHPDGHGDAKDAQRNREGTGAADACDVGSLFQPGQYPVRTIQYPAHAYGVAA